MVKILKRLYLNIGGLGSMRDLNATLTWFSSPEWAGVDGTFTIFSIFITSFTLFFAYRNWLNNKKQLKKIDIFLEFYDGYKEKIYPIKRKNFSRAELKGILRELHDDREHYKLSYMAENEFLDGIFKVQDGESDEFIMKIREKDFFKFNRKT